MPRDMPFEPAHRTPLRSAVLDLIADAGGARPEEPDYLAELREIIASRSHADELWDMYRGGDRRARGFRRLA